MKYVFANFPIWHRKPIRNRTKQAVHCGKNALDTHHKRTYGHVFIHDAFRLLISCEYSLSVSVGALYVRQYFDDNVRHLVIDMVENIRAAFIKMLHDVSWMDETTKQKAIVKARALVAHIGYPNELTNDTKIEEYYKDLEVTDHEYLMNAIRLNLFKTDYGFRQLHKPINKTDWLAHASPNVINAFYSAIENSIRKYRTHALSTAKSFDL